MSARHANISVFVPHIGCPGRCSFCDQTKIARTVTRPTAEDVDKAVAAAQKSRVYDPQNTEIAFFGGSFTAIDEDYMISLLAAAAKYVENGTVSGIRASTRPDAVDDRKLSILKKHHVTALELGAQSMDDRVLKLNHRGHNAAAVENASALIKKHGISLGLQMMTGLLGDTDAGALYTARKIIELKPDTVRIYPTIVLKGTMLEQEYIKGNYRPQTVEEAVRLSAKLLEMFKKTDVEVIRLGLHEIDVESYVAGPWHPAFGELTESAVILEKLKKEITEKGSYTVYCSPDKVSKTVGQKRCNVSALKEMGIEIRVKPCENAASSELRIVKD